MFRFASCCSDTFGTRSCCVRGAADEPLVVVPASGTLGRPCAARVSPLELTGGAGVRFSSALLAVRLGWTPSRSFSCPTATLVWRSLVAFLFRLPLWPLPCLDFGGLGASAPLASCRVRAFLRLRLEPLGFAVDAALGADFSPGIRRSVAMSFVSGSERHRMSMWRGFAALRRGIVALPASAGYAPVLRAYYARINCIKKL
eukprot:scaffold140_cov247-Pinguiococcus_pyrenoidosus.AAC.23